MKEANKWLEKTFTHRYNRRFAQKPQSYISAFRKISKPEIYLKVSYAYEAIVGNDNCVRLGGLTIDIPEPSPTKSFAKKKVLVKAASE